MYHYVRDLKSSRYPAIKGLALHNFKIQIEFLKSNFNILSCDELIDYVLSGKDLPEKSMLLTFDDGYIDHYTNILPILNEHRLSAFFSIPGRIIAEGKLLDVNKLHFILASADIDELVKTIFARMDHYRGKEYNIPSNEALYNELAVPNRFDNGSVVFVKRALQAKLPEKLRNTIVDELFVKYIPLPENSFAKELYLNLDQIKMMKRCGMSFGIHGYDHYWLEHLPEEAMQSDIKKAISVFDGIIDRKKWIMCHPGRAPPGMRRHIGGARPG